VSDELETPEPLKKPQTQEEPRDFAKSEQRVGYCSPPEATRFRKGVSGNPKGRPKGSLNVITALTKALREKVVINENGRRKTVTKLEAALKQLVNKAATGDLRALRHLTELAQDAEKQQSLNTSNVKEELNELDREVMEGILRRFQTVDGANTQEKEN
jgi:uncharacterized protein DUF5681